MTETHPPTSLGLLAHVPVGFSVSDSANLPTLGFTETHLRMTLGELARSLLLADASIMYGGRIDPEGYTDFFRRELEKYSRRDRPMMVCLAWSEHRRMSLVELAEARHQIGLYGKIICLDLEGQVVDGEADRSPNPQQVEEDEVPTALTALRRFMNGQAAARILVGGRRSDYQGQMPGVLEEAQLALAAGRPIFLVGGFGGVTSDIARSLGFDPANVLPHFSTSNLALEGELHQLAEIARDAGWTQEANGLTYEENCRLAASHRPGEVASLILVGLRRLNDSGQLNRLQ